MSRHKKKRCIKSELHGRMHKLMHSGHAFFHFAYLGLVSIESHGYYGKAALVLVGITILGYITGDHEVL